MAEPTQFSFTFKELATALVKQAGLTSGIWGVQVRFGISARNIGGNENDIVPAAIVPIVEIGLQKFETENNLSVDASVVSGIEPPADSPKPTSTRRRRATKA